VSVRENRSFLARAVWFLAAEAGIRQFIDIEVISEKADRAPGL